MSSFCLLPLTYGYLSLGLVGTVVENDRQGLLILASLKFSCGRLAEETLLGRRVWGGLQIEVHWGRGGSGPSPGVRTAN